MNNLLIKYIKSQIEQEFIDKKLKINKMAITKRDGINRDLLTIRIDEFSWTGNFTLNKTVDNLLIYIKKTISLYHCE